MSYRLQKQHSLKKSALKPGVDSLIIHFEVLRMHFRNPSYFFVRVRGHSKVIQLTRFPYKRLLAEINDPKDHTKYCKFTIGQGFLSVSLYHYPTKPSGI